MKENSLSKIGDSGGAGVGDLQNVERNLQMAIQTGNSDAIQAVELELKRRPGVFSILFPGRILKENEELQIQNMKDMYKMRQNLLNAWINVKLEMTKNQGEMIIEKQCQTYGQELKTQDLKHLTELTDLAAKKRAEIQETLLKSQKDFSERIDDHMKDAEVYKKTNKVLYKALQDSFAKQIETFMRTTDELLNSFIDSLTKKHFSSNE